MIGGRMALVTAVVVGFARTIGDRRSPRDALSPGPGGRTDRGRGTLRAMAKTTKTTAGGPALPETREELDGAPP